MYLPHGKITVILYPVIDRQRFFVDVTLGHSVILLNLSHFSLSMGFLSL